MKAMSSQTFFRVEDPETSREASKQRKRDPGPEHYFVLRHHAEHLDSDANAGQAALEAGFVYSKSTVVAHPGRFERILVGPKLPSIQSLARCRKIASNRSGYK